MPELPGPAFPSSIVGRFLNNENLGTLLFIETDNFFMNYEKQRCILF